MKYKTIVDTEEFKDFKFFEDGIGKYMIGKDAGAAQDGWMPLYFTEVKEEHENGNVLDKVRAEIENHCGLIKENHCKYCSYCNSVMGVREILEIIDKYKNESEVTE